LLGHVLFGDRDVLLGIASLIGLTFAVFAVGRRLLALTSQPADVPLPRQRRRNAARRRTSSTWVLRIGPRRLVVAGLAAAIALVVQASGVQMVQVLISEQATWLLILAAAYLLLGEPSTGRLVAVALCAGAATVVRANQIPAALMVVGLAVAAGARHAGPRRARVTVAVLGSFLAVALLPALHNAWYGGKLQLVAGTPDLPVNFPLPPADLLRVADPEVRRVLFDQLAGVVVTRLRPIDLADLRAPFLLAVHTIQVFWLAALVRLWLVRRRVAWWAWVVVLLPAAYLIPHVFIQVYVYYPRHIMMGYLAMGVAAAFAFGEAGLRAGAVSPGRA
jgi:hypothetical protein